MYTLHFAPDNASLIIRLALEHICVPYRCALVDRAAKAQRGAEYRAINPNGLIPALETPDSVLFETGAILLWLADRHSVLAPPPQDPGRGDFLKWLFFTANTLHPALRMMFYSDTYIADDATEALQTRLQESIPKHLHMLDRHSDQWLSDPVNVLHFYVAACLRWCALYPADRDNSWFQISDYPSLKQMCVQLETLPCVAHLCAAEGMSANPFTAPDYPTPPIGSAT